MVWRQPLSGLGLYPRGALEGFALSFSFIFHLFSSLLPSQIQGSLLWAEQVCLLLLWLPLLLDASVCVCARPRVYESVRVFSPE